MIDPGREVQLVAGETTYILYAGNRALRLIERETGKPLTDAIEDMQRGSVGLMTTMLWSMLQQHHPTMTLDDVDEVIDAAGYEAIGEAVGEAANRAFATGDGGNDAGKAPALNGTRVGTGRRSSPAPSPQG